MVYLLGIPTLPICPISVMYSYPTKLEAISHHPFLRDPSFLASSMPIKAFDYFAAGLPLINSLGMDLGNLINDFSLGLNYKAGDADDLFQKIIYFNNNRDLIKKMRQNCLNISNRFDTSKIYLDYVKFCEDVVLDQA